MAEKDKNGVISDFGTINDIENLIYNIRGKQVMLDFDLAALYGYEVRALNQQVKRNINRFPDDFMFQLSQDEIALVKSQFVISRDNYFLLQNPNLII